MSSHFEAVCLDCGHKAPFSAEAVSCPRCKSQWREAQYNYPFVGKSLAQLVRDRPFDLWRYRELMPVGDIYPALSMGEGGTPLIHAVNLGMMLGCPHIYIKDERQGPTSSFKDRQAAVNVAALKEAGITEVVLASTGNVAIAYSAYAVRAGIKVWAFLTSLVPAEKMREVAIYGTQVVKVTGSYDQAKQIAAEFAQQRGLYLELGSRSIPSVEAMKTIAFEIGEQLSQVPGLPTIPTPHANNGHNPVMTWRSPDWYIQAVSGGLGPLGVLKGFTELQAMGLTDRLPAMASIQTEGCSPMVKAWKDRRSIAEPVRTPRTHIATLSTGDPGRTYSLLYERTRKNDRATFESVTDEESYRAMHILAKMEGISVEPAAAVAFAGMIKMIRAGTVKPDDVIVVNCTGHTMPIEGMILGDGWSRNVDLSSSQHPQETPQEGLLAALSQLSVERYPQIAVVDDSTDARRLIRRILQAHGEYRIFEAKDGQEAITLAKRERLDLIILDLMMPEVDGFSVLDALKDFPQTASVPVIVVTAKELTIQEKKHLKGRIYSLMQKGEFLSDELLAEVRTVVD